MPPREQKPGQAPDSPSRLIHHELLERVSQPVGVPVRAVHFAFLVLGGVPAVGFRAGDFAGDLDARLVAAGDSRPRDVRIAAAS